MFLKKVMIALAMFAVVGTAFAEEEGTYAKVTLGYTKGDVDEKMPHWRNDYWNDPWRWNWDVAYYSPEYHGVEIMPAFGFQLPVLEDKPFSFALEFQLPIAIGKDNGNGYKCEVMAVEPTGMFMFNWHFGPQFNEFLQHFVPYGGLGFGIPIRHVEYEWESWWWDGTYRHVRSEEKTQTEIGFTVNMSLGARYDFTKSVGLLSEMNWGFWGDETWSFRIGGMFRL